MPDASENKWKIFLLVATSIFMSTLDSSIVNVALPYIMQDLSTDIQTIQWIVLIYLVTISSLLLTFGRLSDIKGRKPIYICGFSIFVIGSFLCGLSQSPECLIISRLIQGSGAAMLMACSPALIVDVFPAQERGKALGMIGAVVAAGLTTGPVVGGIILEYLSWRYIFYINIPIGMAAIFYGLILFRKIQSSKGSHEPLDVIGSVLLIITLASFIIFVTQISRWGLISFPSSMFFMIALVSMVCFVMNEKKSKFPLLDMVLLKERLFVFPVIASAILFASLFVVVFLMPFYLTYPCGFSASKTGFIMIVPFLFLLVVSPVSGVLFDKVGSMRLCLLGMSLLLASLISLSMLSPIVNIFSILWRIALAGIGTALFVSPNNTIVMSRVPMPRRGIASGAVATARNLGMVIGVALAGLVFTTSFSRLTNGATLGDYTQDMAPFFMTSFKQTMLTGAILAGLGIWVTFLRGAEDSKPE